MKKANYYYGAPGLREYFLSLGADCTWRCDDKNCCYWIDESNEVQCDDALDPRFSNIKTFSIKDTDQKLRLFGSILRLLN